MTLDDDQVLKIAIGACTTAWGVVTSALAVLWLKYEKQQTMITQLERQMTAGQAALEMIQHCPAVPKCPYRDDTTELFQEPLRS